jgi:alpha-beta hydrolase superfamily lysophospholipase
VRARLTAEGWPLDALRDAYRSFDVTGNDLRVRRARVAIFAGIYDQIAPLPHLADFARHAGIARLLPYRRGHALLLLQRHMYRDYGRVLDADLRAAP